MTSTVVVGAAILRDGLLLAARRTSPPAAAGRWELPGGKVDAGESDDEALVREIDEELGVRVAVARWLPGEEPLVSRDSPGVDLVLRVAVAQLVAGEPEAREHDRLRWLDAREVGDVDWLDGDRPFVTAVAPLLRESR